MFGHEARFQKTESRNEIIETVNGVGITADEKNWSKCLALFADEVELDYTSLIGGEPIKYEAFVLIANWKQMLDPVQATQHSITNHQVTMIGLTEASCLSHVQASHWHAGAPGGASWVLWGTYRHRLIKADEGWVISGMKLSVKWQEGNRNLINEAASIGKS